MTTSMGIITAISWGEITPFEFTSYEELVERFHKEVEELWEQEDGE